jgi:hypothetical protein
MPDSIETVKVNQKFEQTPDGMPLTATAERPVPHAIPPVEATYSPPANVQDKQAPYPAAPLNPYDSMIERAMVMGLSPEMISKFMDLADRRERADARKAFIEAMTEFKKDPPALLKTKKVTMESKDANKKAPSFSHAELGEICEEVIEKLAMHGLSHQWRHDQSTPGIIKVTCILTHLLGHSEEDSMISAPDSSGSKNAVQQVSSASTYLERYTLLAVTGLKPKGMDDDGRAFGTGPADPELVKEWVQQINEAIAECEQAGDPVKMPAFLKWLASAMKVEKIESLSEINQTGYTKAMYFLSSKRRKAEGKAPIPGAKPAPNTDLPETKAPPAETKPPAAETKAAPKGKPAKPAETQHGDAWEGGKPGF